MADVGVVQKTGLLPVGQGKKAPVATVEDLTRAIQPLAARHGVVFMPIRIESTTILIGKTQYDNDIFRTDATVTWLVAHRDSDQTFECQTIGAGNDSGDKGAYKAMTGAEKYLHRLILCIPTGNDPDKEQSTETRSASKSQSAAKNHPPEPEPSPYISAAQRTRLGAAITGAAEQAAGGKLDQVERDDVTQCVTSVLSGRGYASSKLITVADYEATLQACKTAVTRLVLGPGSDDDDDPSGDTDSDPIPGRD